MRLSAGIVGLPNVGKSTIFKILTKQDVVVANYPFATVDPNIGVVPVKDERLDKVAELVGPEKVVPAVIEFYDIAGLIKGAHKGEGLGNQFLAKIREVSVLVHVVRLFERGDVPHTGEINPASDIDTVNSELILKDLETVERSIEKAEKEAKTGDKEKIRELEELKRVQSKLSEGEMAYGMQLPEIGDVAFLTAKPQVYLLNGTEDELPDNLGEKLKDMGSEYVVADLEKADYLDTLIDKTYKALGLITFFTIVGGKEARAWAISEGTPVREAAGEVHTDFEEKFIRADVINWEKLVEAGGWQEAKQKGLIRTEGKEYIVGDGDVVVVKHS